MPKRSRKTAKTARRKAQPKRDENRAAFDALQQVIQETEGTGKNPLAVLFGRMGGLKGGRVRSERLTDEQKRESAKMAAKARWSKHSRQQ